MREDLWVRHNKRHENKQPVRGGLNKKVLRRAKFHHQLDLESEIKKEFLDTLPVESNYTTDVQLKQEDDSPFPVLFNDSLLYSPDLEIKKESMMNSLPMTDVNVNLERTRSPANLISWLFFDSMLPEDGYLDPRYDLQHLMKTPIRELSDSNNEISEAKRLELLQLLPSALSNNDHDASLTSLQSYIDAYWQLFHPQYPILHRPSFDIDTCPAGLLWSIVLIGAMFLKVYELSNSIAEPLRWVLFRAPDFEPPTKLWVVQALVLLEMFEKSMANRRIHERGHVHHGSTLQLIRSVLIDLELHKREDDPWQKWVDREAAKRTALMAFMIDVTDSTMFNHSMIMSLDELRLNLPCSDAIWESCQCKDKIKKSNDIPVLEGLKMILNKTHVETTAFGRKVLLGSLLCLALQMLECDLHDTSERWYWFKERWRSVLGPAYDFWKEDYDNQSRSSLVNNDLRVLEFEANVAHLYHLAHISMCISLHDIQLFARYPNAMNQPAQDSGEMALKRWVFGSSDSNIYGHHDGNNSLWHAIKFLSEIYFGKFNSSDLETYEKEFEDSGQSDKLPRSLIKIESEFRKSQKQIKAVSNKRRSYRASEDPIDRRPISIYYSALAIWAYGYCSDGPESRALKSTEVNFENMVGGTRASGLPEERAEYVLESMKHIESKEDGYDFLNRLSQYRALDLDTAKGKNHTAGLLRLVADSLKGHYSEIIQECRRLLIACIEQSLGRDKKACEYMFNPRT